MIHGSLKDLEALLSLEPVGAGLYSGGHVSGPRSRVYGGQFLGQGLIAASQVCAGPVRSFHCYYLRAGSTDSPLTYSARAYAGQVAQRAQVEATQNGRIVFTMEVAFGEFAAAPAVAMPSVPPPARCIARAEGIQGLSDDTDATWAVTDAPFDYRFVENIWEDGYAAAGHNVWFRARDPGQLDPGMPQTMTQAMTAYFADDPIMDNALFPHGWQRSWRELQTASLDHAMWFHASVNLGDWLLFAQDSPVAAGGRGMTRGRIFASDGQLIASACQEILMRKQP